MILEGHEADWEEWRKMASLEKYPELRWLSVLSPFWVVATFIVCWYHARQHASVMGERSSLREATSGGFLLHEKVIRILLLPVIYGLDVPAWRHLHVGSTLQCPRR
eukprot:SRR837773.22763.p1 GENE.SRR837773.22763~~SRR837773.22763.p1  ORF type:complete len:123 (+),score=29.34 SRR837773.22763:54-371(+)